MDNRLDPRFAARERQPGLDLLRAAAVLMVICYHAGLFGFALPGDVDRFGWVGVDLFFVLSGFLIGGQLLARIKQGRPISLRTFFWRRALRILPAYYVTLAIYGLIPSWREWPHLPAVWKFLLFGQNIGLNGGTAFSHAWSLCVEGQFYLALPFLLLLLKGRRRLAMATPLVVVLAGLGVRAALGNLPGLDGRMFQRLIYYPTWSRLDPLVCGVTLAAVRVFRLAWWDRLMASARWLWLPALAAISGGLYLGEGNSAAISKTVWQFPLIAAGMAGLLVCAVSERLPLRRTAVPGTAFLASVAYSVYLSHKLAIHAMLAFCARYNLALDGGAAILLNVGAMLAVGSAMFFAVERPFLEWRRKATR